MNIITNHKFKDQSTLIILIVSIAIAFSASYYLLSLLILIQLIISIRKHMKMKQIEDILLSIENYNWNQQYCLIKNILQYLKCCKMIELGYHSKSNTNIMMQQQMNHKFQNDIREKEIIELVLSYCKKLILVKQIIKIKDQTLLNEQDNYPFIPHNLDRFSDIFKLSRQFHSLFKDINQLEPQFQRQISSPLTQIKSNNDFIIKYTKLIPLLEEIKGLFLSLNLMFYSQNSLVATNRLNKEYIKILNLINSQKLSEQDINNLNKFTAEMEALLPSFSNEDQAQKISQIYQQGSQNKSQYILKDANIQNQNSIDRRQFAKKLDHLLMIGLARKRQQQYEKKLKLLQQDQL